MMKQAFNSMVGRGRTMTLVRLAPDVEPPEPPEEAPEDLEITVKALPSNYARNLEAPSDMVVEGREFILRHDDLVGAITGLKRGDRLVDEVLGEMTIDTITEMFDFGGSIMGYRVRTA